MEPFVAPFIVYSLQIAVVVAIAAGAAAVCRVSSPAFRLAYWRAVGCACLALLHFASNAQAAASAEMVEGSAFPASAWPQSAVAVVASFAGGREWLASFVFWTWAAGVALRSAWLALGCFSLRQLRGARGSSDAREFESLRKELAPRTQIRWTNNVRQPVTFGLRRPVVLLPHRVASLAGDAQRAVVCHELLHVQRLDWAWMLVEEGVRAFFWFHPAVWWLLDQVNLSREQRIDELVVARVGVRKPYMEALMVFADARHAAAASIAMLQRRHLTARLQHLSKEVHMSRMRLVLKAAALAVVLISSPAVVSSALPLDLAALALQSSPRVEIRLAENTPGSGVTEAVLDGSGRRIYLHPAALITNEDITSARVNSAGGVGATVGVTFTDAAAKRLTDATRSHLGRPVAILIDGRVVSAIVVRAPIGGSAAISGVTGEQARSLAAALDPKSASFGAASQVADATPLKSTDPGVTPPVPVTQVKPVYTPAAMQAGIVGEVLLSAVVQADGSVANIGVTAPLDPELDSQAIAALKQWRFRPAMKDGTAVPVSVDVQFRFTVK